MTYVRERLIEGLKTPDRYLAAADLAADLAPLLDAELRNTPEDSAGSFQIGKLALGDLCLSLCPERGAAFGKVVVSAYAARKVEDQVRRQITPPKFPKATVSTERPLAAIARDIQRRVIEPAAAPLEACKAAAARINGEREELERHAASLRERFPGLEVTIDRDGLSAQLRHPGCYLYATLRPRGSVYFERLDLDAPQAAALLAALLPPPT